LPSLCQKLSDLVEVWRSYNKNNFACFFETRCILDCHRGQRTGAVYECYEIDGCQWFRKRHGTAISSSTETKYSRSYTCRQRSLWLTDCYTIQTIITGFLIGLNLLWNTLNLILLLGFLNISAQRIHYVFLLHIFLNSWFEFRSCCQEQGPNARTPKSIEYRKIQYFVACNCQNFYSTAAETFQLQPTSYLTRHHGSPNIRCWSSIPVKATTH